MGRQAIVLTMLLVACAARVDANTWQALPEKKGLSCTSGSCCSATAALERCAIAGEKPMLGESEWKGKGKIGSRRRKFAKGAGCGVAPLDSEEMALGPDRKGSSCAMWGRALFKKTHRDRFILLLRRVALWANLWMPYFVPPKKIAPTAACCDTLVPKKLPNGKWMGKFHYMGSFWTPEMTRQCCGMKPGSLCTDKNTCRALFDVPASESGTRQPEKRCYSYENEGQLQPEKLGESNLDLTTDDALDLTQSGYMMKKDTKKVSVKKKDTKKVSVKKKDTKKVSVKKKFSFFKEVVSHIKTVGGKLKDKLKDSAKGALKSAIPAAMNYAIKHIPMPPEAKSILEILLDFYNTNGKDDGTILNGNRKQEWLEFVRRTGPKFSPIMEKFYSDRMSPGFTWVMNQCWMQSTSGLAANPDYYFSVDPLSYDFPRSRGKNLTALREELKDSGQESEIVRSLPGEIKLFFGDNWGSYELDNMARGVEHHELRSICDDINGKPMKGCDACENSGGGEFQGPLGLKIRLWPRSDPEGGEEQRVVQEPTCEWHGIFDMHFCKQFKGEPRPAEDQEPKTFLEYAFATSVSGCKSGAWTHRVIKTSLRKDNGTNGLCAKHYSIASAFMQMMWGYITTNLATAMYSGCLENMG